MTVLWSSGQLLQSLCLSLTNSLTWGSISQFPVSVIFQVRKGSLNLYLLSLPMPRHKFFMTPFTESSGKGWVETSGSYLIVRIQTIPEGCLSDLHKTLQMTEGPSVSRLPVPVTSTRNGESSAEVHGRKQVASPFSPLQLFHRTRGPRPKRYPRSFLVVLSTIAEMKVLLLTASAPLLSSETKQSRRNPTQVCGFILPCTTL